MKIGHRHSSVPAPVTHGSEPTTGDSAKPGLGERIKDKFEKLQQDQVATKVIAATVGVATIAPAVLTGVAAIADAGANKLPPQNLEVFDQQLPQELQGSEGLAHAIESYQDGKDPFFEVPVDALYQSVTNDFLQVKADPQAAPKVEGEMVNVVVATHPVIHSLTDEYKETKAELKQAEQDEGWLRRTFHDTDQVNQLQAKEHQLRDELVELRGVHGAANIVLGMDDTLPSVSDSQATLDALLQASSTAQKSGSHDAWVQALSQQAKGHDALAKVVKGADADTAAAVQAAVDNRAAHSNFTNRVGWVDTVFGGKSLEGNLYREGVGQVKEARGNLDQLRALQSKSETSLYNGINELLKTENPQYRETRAQYDQLKPVHDELNDVMSGSQKALNDLEHAEDAIAYRNMVRASEPPYWETVSEPQYDSNGKFTGYETRQQESAAHKSWESQMSSAEWAASIACNDAEREVRALNGHVSELKGAMQRANLEVEFKTVKSDINWFLGENFSWGLWSYDSSQVNEIQREIGQLREKVAVVQGQVDTTFHPLETEVWNTIHARQAELLKMP